jgi:hypothetical protein
MSAATCWQALAAVILADAAVEALALDVARGYVEQGAYVVAFVNFLLALVQL